MITFKEIEFNKIKKIIKSFCQSSESEILIDNLKPQKNIDKIRKQLELKKDIKNWSKKFNYFDLSQLSNIEKLLFDYKYETYKFEELLDIHLNIVSGNKILKKLDDVEDLILENEFQYFITKINRIKELNNIEKRFYKIFDSKGNVKDSASAKLKRIRKSIKSSKKNINSELSSFMNGQNSKFVQENIVSYRNDRYTIPIKSGSENFVNGIVIDRSQTKSSVFFEPEAVVKLNNNLKSILNDEKKEIYQILKEFSKNIKNNKETIAKNTDLLFEIDSLQAVIKFSKKINAEIPKLINKPELTLIDARHPLLIHKFDSFEKVIPFNLTIGKKNRMLVISGPNTGGKTVTLKSIGLLTAMILSGIPIPVDEKSEIGIFENIIADIGDDQSLENDLSTFSSHIAKIKNIIKYGNRNSLILIDEIGSATDPEQGSALAQAILEDLQKKEVLTVATTHFTNIKAFADQTENCINASMIFDSKKHVPTYNFKLGLPGNSFAIQIAERLNLSEKIIQRAKKLAGNENIKLTELIKKVSEAKKELGKQSYQAQLNKKVYEQRIEDYKLKLKKFEAEKKQIKKDSLKKAKSYLTDFQKELKFEIEQFKKSDRKNRKTIINKTENKIANIKEELDENEISLNPQKFIKLDKLEEGMEVYVKDFDDIGIIIEIKNKKIKLDINGFYYTTNKNKIFKAMKKKSPIKKETKIPKFNQEKKEVKMELKILGMTFEEAHYEVDQYIDDSLIQGMTRIRIVHGKGTGVLRQKIRNYLHNQRMVKSYKSAEPSAGGNGVTVVTLKNE